jgi:hypothetical protein
LASCCCDGFWSFLPMLSCMSYFFQAPFIFLITLHTCPNYSSCDTLLKRNYLTGIHKETILPDIIKYVCPADYKLICLLIEHCPPCFVITCDNLQELIMSPTVPSSKITYLSSWYFVNTKGPAFWDSHYQFIEFL